VRDHDAVPGVSVLAILDDAETIELMERALAGSGDELAVATDLAEGLARTVAEGPDVVLVDVALGNNAGLAIVHHLRAVAPNVAVYALARSDAVELGTQAVALGGAGLLMLPSSGDELLTLVGDVRARLAEREQRRRLEREATESRRGVSLVARVAGIAEAPNRRSAAEQLARMLEEDAGASPVLVYLPAGEGSRQLMRAAACGDIAGAPSFCDEMELLGYATERGLEVVRLSLLREQSGLLLIGGVRREGAGPLPLVDLVAAQAATSLALLGEREQSTRGAMKDPSSSAYTFAYFVDVAGREIDKARRHGRRFALATLSIDPGPEDEPPTRRFDSSAYAAAAMTGTPPTAPPPSSSAGQSVEVAERVLGAVRDTDVLARVDEHEFYLLLPETGGIGAHTCRRRVMRRLSGPGGQRLGGAAGLDATIGVATFPHDGLDLSHLLRVAKHRQEVSQNSVVRRLALDRLPLGEILDTLLWNVGEPDGAGHPRSIELPAMDLIGLALGAVSEGLRGGAARIVATQRPGVSIGAAVRSALGRDSEELGFRAVDLTGVSGCDDLEALTIVAEHGVYALLGRVDRSVVRAVHASDPLFADLVIRRLGDAVGMRLSD
jgi:GGDEF domain-containing protein/DNA-binding response OmpR family regulator